MCGRFAIFTPFTRLGHVLGMEIDLPQRYNVAPSQDIPIIRLGTDGQFEVATVHWGLIPSWTKDRNVGYSMINARVETVAEKPAFRSAFKHRRCIIPASGLYEWQVVGTKQKQPWLISDTENDGMGFAGLWERWVDPATGETVDSCTIIVGPSNDLVRPVHDRLPCILPPEHYRDWLNQEAPTPFLLALLAPCPSEHLQMWPVPTRIGNPRYDDSELITPLPEPPLQT